MVEKCRIAIYLRVASKDDDAIAAQQERIMRFVEEQGHSASEIYSDNGVSGISLDREAFIQMDADIREGTIHTVYVVSLSRIGRDLFGVSRWLGEMRQRGVTIKAVDGSVGYGCDGSIIPGAFLDMLRQYKQKEGMFHGA